MFIKSIDAGKCTSCMQCEAICANSHVIVRGENGMPEFRYESRCIYCGHCLAVCPEDAISFKPMQDDGRYYAETIERSAAIPPPNPDAAFDFLCSARSTRIFKEQPVEREKLEKVVDAMVRAASAGNEQNRNFYILSNADTLRTLEQALTAHYAKTLKAVQSPVSRAIFAFFGALRAGKQNIGPMETAAMPLKKRYRLMQSILQDAIPSSGSGFSYLKQAPVVILITRGVKNSSIHKAFYRGDACISVTYGILMAKALGLASCWMGLLQIALAKKQDLGKLIPLKPGERLDAAFALGYSDTRWLKLPPRGPVDVTWLS